MRTRHAARLHLAGGLEGPGAQIACTSNLLALLRNVSRLLQSNEETELMVRACSEAGVQLMDGTMWMHNPRALHMRSVLDDARAVGRLRTVTSSFAFSGRPPPQHSAG